MTIARENRPWRQALLWLLLIGAMVVTPSMASAQEPRFALWERTYTFDHGTTMQDTWAQRAVYADEEVCLQQILPRIRVVITAAPALAKIETINAYTITIRPAGAQAGAMTSLRCVPIGIEPPND